MGKTAIIIGATGLVGKHLLQQVLDDDFYSKVKVFVRRTTNQTHEKLEEYIIDFDQLAQVQSAISGDVLFSCLGTTLKQAGGQKAQYKVDFTYQYEFASLAKKQGITSYFLVSSAGANSKSNFFYQRMKGQLEEAVLDLEFDRTVFIQPSVLQGEREQNRFGEHLAASVINRLGKVIPPLKRFRSIKGSEVAAAMSRIYKSADGKNIEVYKLDQLF